MPLLAGLLWSAFSGVVGFLASFIGKKLAVGAALGVFLVTGWIALQVGVYGLWVGLGFVVPAGLYNILGVVLYLVPYNAFACVNAYVAARIARWVWNQQRQHAFAISMIT